MTQLGGLGAQCPELSQVAFPDLSKTTLRFLQQVKVATVPTG